MLDARQGYADWGATGKVAALDRQYPALISGGVRRPRTQSGKKGTPSGETSSGALDLASVLKASQALSSEIDLDRLLEKMMLIVLENAGAERGVLIMEEGNQLLVRAEGGPTAPSLCSRSLWGSTAGSRRRPSSMSHVQTKSSC